MDSPPTVQEILTRQFYEWELRGRGWLVWPVPVDVEPPFRPFLGHYIPRQFAVDDAATDTGWSLFGGAVRKLLGVNQKTPPAQSEPQEIEPEPTPLIRSQTIELQTLLPVEFESKPGLFEQFLQSLLFCRDPVSFEIVGRKAEVVAQFAISPEDIRLVQKQLKAFFPLATFVPRERALPEFWNDLGDAETAVVDFGLSLEFMRPLASPVHDPFIAIAGALSELEEGELGVFQVLFCPTRSPWLESIVRAVTDDEGDSFFLNDPDLPRQTKQKLSSHLSCAVSRIATRSWSYERTWEIARSLGGALHVFSDPGGNSLIPLSNDGYPISAHVEDVLRRQTRRSGMILNLEELAGLVHLPSDQVTVPEFQRQRVKTKAAPSICDNQTGICLGLNSHGGKTRQVFLTPEQRVRHMHLIGASGTGKSTLLFNLIKQSIDGGQGVAVLDPHGDLVDKILGVIPEERIDDVILLDPADDEYAIGFNILSAHSELEKSLLASDLVSVFERLSTSWGDQMASVLSNGIRAFLESSQGGTLVDLRRFLLEPDFRQQFLGTVTDPEIVYYWQKAFPNLGSNRSIGPILTRLETFLSPKPIRYMVSQKENRLDFGSILDSGKIFLAKLAQGLIGRENSYLLGTLLVAKLQQLAMSRQRQLASARRDFWLFIDEFHNFITPSMTEILTGARKYRLGLILAHQDLRQLQRDSEVSSAVLSNTYTRICFRVGDDDAKKLADGFASFDVRDLQNLSTGEAICRVERSDFDFNLAVPAPETTENPASAERSQLVIQSSRNRYGARRADIEAALRRTAEVPKQAIPEAEKARKPEPRPAPEVAATPTTPKTPEEEITPATSAARETAAPMPATDFDEQSSQHQALKERIKAEAENLDFVAKLEQLVLNGRGRVDVALQRGSRSVACEISVTTTIEHEVGNVKKCLEGGYAHVAVICLTKRRLAHIREAVNRAVSSDSERVGYYLPNEFAIQLSEWATGDPVGGAAEKLKPRKRKITLDCGELSPEQRRQREDEMIQQLAEEMKRTPPAS